MKTMQSTVEPPHQLTLFITYCMAVFLFLLFLGRNRAIELIRYSPYTIKEREELCDFFFTKTKIRFFLRHEKSAIFIQIVRNFLLKSARSYYFFQKKNPTKIVASLTHKS